MYENVGTLDIGYVFFHKLTFVLYHIPHLMKYIVVLSKNKKAYTARIFLLFETQLLGIGVCMEMRLW